MSNERVPQHEQSLIGHQRTTPWEDARERLANPGSEEYSHAWLATVRPNGRPHLMPLISFWMEGGLHFIVGEGTRKGRNLASNPWCVIGTENRKVPSLDVIVEGRAEPLTDPDEVRRIAEVFASRNWPLEVRGVEVHGPNAPTAGPPPYRIYRLTPSRAFGLPGNYGLFQVEPGDLPKPTRWDFAAD
ncbi:MAG TPA: pyridoxamine 5'-phosphate oxidase family protein [Candidatus Limnocylindria bacterium]|nr:pyridoxamine 5'-phosphate oxidase family protein [Candidatus Limnocylindria bacterium]